MRIYDGGAYANLDVMGDFAYWDDNGTSFMIECKATRNKSLPFTNFKRGQIQKLLDFNGAYRHGIIAVNFYGENYRTKNDCYLIHVDDFVDYATTSKRKSIPESEVARIGVICPKASGFWELPFNELEKVKCSPVRIVYSSSHSKNPNTNDSEDQKWENVLF